MKTAKLKDRWLAAFLTVILVMSAVFFVSSMLTLRAIERDADRSHEQNAGFMQNMLDESWQRVYDYSWQIINAPSARQMEQEDLTELLPTAYAFSRDFQNYIQSNKMVEDIYLYYPKSGMVVGNRGVYDKHVYWVTLYGIDKRISEECWNTELLENRTRGYFTIQAGSQLELYYRVTSFKDEGRVLFARINTEELETTLRWICDDNASSFLAMADENGKIYAYAGSYEQFADAETNTVSDRLSDAYLVTEKQSDITKLTYLTITEKSQAYRLVTVIMRISLILLIAAAAVSVLIAVAFTRRSVQPIERQIDSLLEENRQSVEQLERQREMMVRRTFLSEALKTGTLVQRDIEVIAGFYGLEFDNERYVIIVRERAGEDYSDKILRYLSEFEETPAILCWTQQQDLDVFFLNYDLVARNGHDDLADFLSDLKARSSPASRIVCSRTVEYLEQIRGCYLDCLQQLGRVESTMLPGKAELRSQEQGFQLGAFQNYVYDEDYLAAREMLPQLCGLLFEDASDQTNYLGRKYYLLTWLRIKKRPIPEELIQQFLDDPTPSGTADCLYAILTELEQQKSADSLSTGIDDIAGKARCIIDESYDNPMLGLCMLSEQICYSQSYISKAFKKKYGIGVSQYVNQVRIARAKKLIRDGSRNIKEIALQVGYSSDAQFIRVFKKFEAVTPGVFRAENEQPERGSGQ